MSLSFGLSIVTLSFKIQLLPFLSCKLLPNFFSPLDYFSKCGVGVEWERERQREKSHFLKGAIMVFSRLAAFSGTKKLIHSPCQGKQIWTFLSRGTPGHVTLWLWWIETWVGLTQVVGGLGGRLARRTLAQMWVLTTTKAFQILPVECLLGQAGPLRWSCREGQRPRE